jgi:hypothetical protein
MKFTILDTGTTQQHDIHTYSDTYKYLDDFLDHTFITDYFMNSEQHRRSRDGHEDDDEDGTRMGRGWDEDGTSNK